MFQKPINRYELPLVKDFMTTRVLYLTPEQSLDEVIKIFNDHRISSAPVLDGDGLREVVGFLTEDDCLRELVGGSFFQTPAFPTVASSMARNIRSLSPDMDVFQAEVFFRDYGLRHAPVVDEAQRLLGIVARRDIMRALEKIMEQVGVFTHKKLTPPKFSMMTEAEWRLSSHQL